MGGLSGGIWLRQVSERSFRMQGRAGGGWVVHKAGYGTVGKGAGTRAVNGGRCAQKRAAGARRHRGSGRAPGGRAPLIYAADRARCTVARPQRSARATARTLSPAASRRRISASRPGRFSGAPVARSCPRFQPARFPPGHKRPSSAGSASSTEEGRARPSQHPAAPAAKPALPIS